MTGMTEKVVALLTECGTHDIQLSRGDGELLEIDAPQGALTSELLDRLRAGKAALLEVIEEFEERAAIMEFDAGLSRHEAERLVRDQYFAHRTALR
jgi:hypothetical protein